MNKILLLEDDLSLIDGLQYSLNKNGFQIDVVRTVEEAKNRLVEMVKYDLLMAVMYMQMQIMDYWD